MSITIMEKNQILTLFQTIQQQSATLGIAKGDEEFCRDNQAAYEEAMDFYNALAAHIEANQPKQNVYAKERVSVKTCMVNAQKSFIKEIYANFRDSYHVTLSPEKTMARYKLHDDYAYTRHDYDEPSATPIHYREIVQDILAQTGNLPFGDLAVHQLKAAFAPKVTWRSKDERVKQTGATLHIEAYAYLETRYDGGLRLKYSGERPVQLLYRVLSHFERGEIVKQDALFESLPGMGNAYDVDLTPYPVNGDKVNAVRFYKNGKIAVKFASSIFASEFKRDYCHEVVA